MYRTISRTTHWALATWADYTELQLWTETETDPVTNIDINTNISYYTTTTVTAVRKAIESKNLSANIFGARLHDATCLLRFLNNPSTYPNAVDLGGPVKPFSSLFHGNPIYTNRTVTWRLKLDRVKQAMPKMKDHGPRISRAACLEWISQINVGNARKAWFSVSATFAKKLHFLI